MKPETETMLMKQHFQAMKESAAKCLLAMGAEPKEGVEPCSWEGMMTMLEDVMGHGSPAQKAAAVLAAAKWTHGHLECETMSALEGAETLLATEAGDPAGKKAPAAGPVRRTPPAPTE